MRGMKRLLGTSAILLSLVLFLIPSRSKAVTVDSPVLYQGDVVGDAPCPWSIHEDGTLLVQAEGEMPVPDSREYPWEVYNDVIKKIVIDDMVSSVSVEAFYGLSGVSEIYIGKSVKQIGENSFRKVGYIDRITMYDSVGYLKPAAFADDEIENVTLYGTSEYWSYLEGEAEELNEPLFEARVTYEEESSPVTYTVTFMVQGQLYAQKTVNEGDYVILPDEPIVEGYTFEGWMPDLNGPIAEDTTVEAILREEDPSGDDNGDDNGDNDVGDDNGDNGENDDGKDDKGDEEGDLPAFDGLETVDERTNPDGIGEITGDVQPEPDVDVSIWVRDSDGRFFRVTDDAKNYSDSAFCRVSLVDSRWNFYKSFSKFLLRL